MSKPALPAWTRRALPWLLAAGLCAGCENNSSVEQTPGTDLPSSGLTVTPATVRLGPGETNAVYTVRGGEAPFAWTVSDARLGTVPETSAARTVNYRRAGTQVGVNTLRVRDAAGNSATALAIQDLDLLILPAVARLGPGTTGTVFSVEGGTPPFAWSVSNAQLGAIPATDSRIAAYNRVGQSVGTNAVQVRDARGLTANAMVEQVE